MSFLRSIEVCHRDKDPSLVRALKSMSNPTTNKSQQRLSTLEPMLPIRWLWVVVISAVLVSCDVRKPPPIVVQVEVTEIVVVTSTPEVSSTPTAKPTPTFTETPVLVLGSSGWYENLTQDEMASLAENSQRLFEIDSSGSRTPIPLHRIDEHTYFSDAVGLEMFLPTFFGIIIDLPRFEQLHIVEYDGNDRVLGVYVVPYLIRAIDGEYVIKDVILGAESQYIVSHATVRANHYPERGPNRYSTITVQEAISRMEANRQYPLMLRLWDDEEQEKAYLTGYAGSDYLKDLFEIHRTYHHQTAGFINALLSGGDIEAFEDHRYLSHMARIIFNLDN